MRSIATSAEYCCYYYTNTSRHKIIAKIVVKTHNIPFLFNISSLFFFVVQQRIDVTRFKIFSLLLYFYFFFFINKHTKFSKKFFPFFLFSCIILSFFFYCCFVYYKNRVFLAQFSILHRTENIVKKRLKKKERREERQRGYSVCKPDCSLFSCIVYVCMYACVYRMYVSVGDYVEASRPHCSRILTLLHSSLLAATQNRRIFQQLLQL